MMTVHVQDCIKLVLKKSEGLLSLKAGVQEVEVWQQGTMNFDIGTDLVEELQVEKLPGLQG